MIKDRADSIAEPMPDSVFAEMLKQLYLQLKHDEQQHSEMVVKLAPVPLMSQRRL